MSDFDETLRLSTPGSLGNTLTGASPDGDMVWIPGGTGVVGSDTHYPEERPAHEVAVDGFWMDRYPVTNERFARFVQATGHVTFAELAPNAADYPGALAEMLHPGSLVFVRPAHAVDIRFLANWWAYILGADWRHPSGPDSSIEGLERHPVVHVAYTDVEAFARWEGKEIPTEAEWEFAARGGLLRATYAWGEEFMPGGRLMANTWQGRFPYENLCEDGFEGTSPVDAFPPNGFGLYDMIGNVWEWTSDWYRAGHASEQRKTCCTPRNPRGGRERDSYDLSQPEIRIPRKVLKGGSHLCAPNYCRRYRPAARHPQPIDTSTGHIGFRCIVRSSTGDLPPDGVC
jgi:sulfatase modifying factor 1